MANENEFTGYNKIRTDNAVANASVAVSRAANVNALASDKSLSIFATGTLAIAVNGIVAGIDGQRMTLINRGTGKMTIADQSTLASAVDRILRQSTATLETTGAGAADLVYSAAASRWILVNLQD